MTQPPGDTVEYHGDEIAVVGLAGRFPGAADVPTLWRNLLDGVDAVHDHTDAELRQMGLDDTLIADAALVRGHGRLAGVTDFDATFFGVSDQEARAMDPQQRLFVEQSWVALSDAGFGGEADERTVGVYAGASANRYFLSRLLAAGASGGTDLEELLVPGWAPDYLPAQVAYRLGLTGPAVAVQTACSSSLVAVCTAAQSLLDFRCDLALAGGVSVTEPRFRHRPDGLVSADGRCRAFDAAGQGSGYGSGVAVLALERLGDALDRGDQVYAVLRGWAVNNDGSARAGFTAPGLAGQVAVVAEALAAASVAPAGIGYVEAHGSGTPVGDAIEVAALTEAFGQVDGPPAAHGGCALGSVKTNLGNLDAAAGVTGLIKAILAVRHGTIPANLHFDQPNPQIAFADGPFTVPVKTTDWTAADGPRRAGVSSFGLGGTNAHVIVEQPPRRPAGTGADPDGPVLLAVSARTPDALRVLAGRLRDRLTADPDLRIGDVARTLVAGRAPAEHRVAVLCADLTGAAAALDRVATGEVAAGALVDQTGGAEGDSGSGTLRGLGERWATGTDVSLDESLPALLAESLAEAGVTDGQMVSLPHHPLFPVRHWIEVPA